MVCYLSHVVSSRTEAQSATWEPLVFCVLIGGKCRIQSAGAEPPQVSVRSNQGILHSSACSSKLTSCSEKLDGGGWCA